MLQKREVRNLSCLSLCFSHSAVMASLSVIKGTFENDEPISGASFLSCLPPRVYRRMTDRMRPAFTPNPASTVHFNVVHLHCRSRDRIGLSKKMQLASSEKLNRNQLLPKHNLMSRCSGQSHIAHSWWITLYHECHIWLFT